MTIAQQLGAKRFPFRLYNEKGQVVYSEYSKGYWWKKEYDERGNEIYYEDSDGIIVDNRPK